MSRYGCESANIDLPKKVVRFLRTQKLTNPIVVPCRQNGLTSSGTRNECHQNVTRLVVAFGGKALRGYAISVRKDRQPFGLKLKGQPYLDIIFHSVWITPEGKAVDVTTYGSGKKESIIFIPLGEYELDTPDVDGTDAELSFTYKKKKGFAVKGISGSVGVPYKEININRLLHGKIWWKKSKVTPEDIKRNIDYSISNGGFSKPSSVTGKYIDEITEIAA